MTLKTVAKSLLLVLLLGLAPALADGISNPGASSGGGGGGSGTVTSVSVTTANGVSGTVATATTTPAISLTLGAITPTTVNGNTFTTGTGTLTMGAGKTITLPNSFALTATDGSTLAIGTGGTLGTNAYTSGFTITANSTATSGCVAGDVLNSDGSLVQCSKTLPSGLTIPGYAPLASPTFTGTIALSGVSEINVSSTVPQIIMGTDTTTGWYRGAANQWWFNGAGTPTFRLFQASAALSSNGIVCWETALNTLGNNCDVGLVRANAGVIKVMNGNGGGDGAFQIGNTNLTLAADEFGLTKIAASGSAPGASGGKIGLVCGSGAGSAKLIAYAGTSTTPVTILDNIGSGVTGC